MHDIEAAYDFGFSLTMVRRAMIYHWRFAKWDAIKDNPDDTAGDLQRWLNRFTDCLDHLGPYIDDATELKLHTYLRHAHEVGTMLIRAHEYNGMWDGSTFGEGTCPGQNEWEKLCWIAIDALRAYPRLQAWFRLGWAVAGCSLSAAISDDIIADADLSRVVEAANSIPKPQQHDAPFLAECAQALKATATYRPIDTLDNLLKTPSNKRPKRNDYIVNHFLKQLMQLDGVIRDSIQLLTTGPRTRLFLDGSDPNNYQAILDGKAYSVKPAQFAILRSLLDAAGDLVTSKVMAEQHGVVLQGRHPSTWIKELHSALNACVQTKPGRGGGSRLVLD